MPDPSSAGRSRALLDASDRKRYKLQDYERRRDAARCSLVRLAAELQALDGPGGSFPDNLRDPGDGARYQAPAEGGCRTGGQRQGRSVR